MATIGKDGKDDTKRVHLACYREDMKNRNTAKDTSLEDFLKHHDFLSDGSNNLKSQEITNTPLVLRL